jgi:hypothetical protein
LSRVEKIAELGFPEDLQSVSEDVRRNRLTRLFGLSIENPYSKPTTPVSESRLRAE